MLQNIRNNVQGTMAKVIIAIIIVPFAVFGIESLFGGGQTDVAIVNGKKISDLELRRAVDMQRQRVLNAMGDNFDPAMLDEARLRGPSLDSLIGQTLLTDIAADSGMRVPVSLLDQLITSMPQFQQDGRFSPDIYLSVLRSQGMSPSLFKERLGTNILIAQLNAGLGESEFVTPQEMELLAGLVAQQRSYRYLIIPASVVAAKEPVTDDEIQAFYESHIDEYQLPEQVKLDYINLRLADFAKPVTEEAIRTEYQSELKAYQASTERRAAHILLTAGDGRSEQETMALAESLKERLEQGQSFDELAKEYSADLGSAANGGDLGYSDGTVFPATFEAALAELSVGEISEPVKTDAGIHLITVTDVRGDQPPSFEERRDDIAARLQARESEPRFLALIEELRDLAFNAETLEQPARELSLTVEHSDWVSEESGTGLFANSRLRSAAFAEDVKKAGHNSEVIELAPDHYVILRVAEQRPPQPMPFSDVRDQVAQRMKEQQTRSLLMEKARTLRNEIADGAALADVAAREGLEWQLADAVRRQTLSVPAEISEAAFAIPAAGADSNTAEGALEIVPMTDAVALIQLDAVIDGSVASLSQQERSALAAQFQRLQGALTLAAFNENVRRQADVKILMK